ncbi:XTP/dITP diphosphatase [Candidatus Nitronereus thalassa]|uniref:dITP/XTP pyrophosphatase n=1 Tax=Candidatus Nitronereus thalassa TaxID=3020898 RepID=A0ABU3K349_9BACT|nr:XTP/dITP diphosphatase [Candidatus Nitronereus thalassa]MDT7040799.1 XTP/dITP diphosphatase [Candidatus Nitronereus thalassa]
MLELVLATGNRDKQKEMVALLSDLPITIRTLNEFEPVPPIIEDGETCEANAMKKATIIANHTGCLALADDTGLEVEALGGRPGVYAARYAGEDATYEDNCRKLLKEMAGVPVEKRSARFVTVVAIADPSSSVQVVEGELNGMIAEARSGNDGFGYDPVFLVPEFGKTLAQMTLEEKNQISHRGRALVKAKAVLHQKIQQ